MADKNYGQLACAKPKDKESGAQYLQVANYYQCYDIATPTPHRSPLNFSNTIIRLDVPDNACELVLRPTAELRHSIHSLAETVNLTQNYDVVQANERDVIPLAGKNIDYVYIVRNVGDGILYFRWNIV